MYIHLYIQSTCLQTFFKDVPDVPGKGPAVLVGSFDEARLEFGVYAEQNVGVLGDRALRCHGAKV